MQQRERCGCMSSDGTRIVCDRDYNHEGQHRGYNEQIDAPMFFGALCRCGHLEDAHGSSYEQRDGEKHYIQQCLHCACQHVTRKGGPVDRMLESLKPMLADIVEGPGGTMRFGTPRMEESCRSSSAGNAGDSAGRSSSDARSVARDWLARQIVKDGREPMLDEGDCRLCGRPDGEGHEATDPCGIVFNLLNELSIFDSVPWREACAEYTRVYEGRAASNSIDVLRWITTRNRELDEAHKRLKAAHAAKVPRESSI